MTKVVGDVETVTDGRLGQLSALCEPQDGRDLTRAPWSIAINDAVWTGATNGRVLAVVPADLGAARLDPARFNAVVSDLVADWPVTGRVAEGVIATWTGPVALPSECRRCHGSGTAACDECNGSGETDCECGECGHYHTATCGECDDGDVVCDHERPRGDYAAIRHGDATLAVIDRALLARIAPMMTGLVEVGVTASDKVVTFRGEGWRVAIMPVLDAAAHAATATPLVLA